MKKRLSVLIVLLLVGSMLFSTAALAEETGESAVVSSTEEVVYGLLDAAGSPKSSHAVVALNVESGGDIQHFGRYTKVRNLTNAEKLDYENGVVNASAEAGRFYYQGEMLGYELPWNVTVSYRLNGEDVTAAQLAGAAGTIEIGIATSGNEAAANPGFFNHYLLQVTVTLDTELCSNIAAEGATLANAGADKQVTFTVLPGSESSNWITCDARDFKMDGVTVAAVPYDVKSALGDASQLTDGLGQLASGTNQLAGGANQLAGGASQLAGGLATYGQYLGELSANSASLVSGSEQIYYGLQQLSANVGSLALLAVLNPEITQLIDGVNALYANYGTFHAGLQQYTGGVDQLAANWGSLESGANQLSSGAYSLAGGAGSLAGATAAIPGQVEGMLGGGEEFVMTSFLSEQNVNVAQVQFIIKTDGVAPQTQEADDGAAAEPSTFLTRLRDLFSSIADLFKGDKAE